MSNTNDVSNNSTDNIFTDVDKVLHSRKSAEPDSSYVASLYFKGLDAILKKVGEEATEVVMAAKDVQADVSESKDKSKNNQRSC